MEHYMAVALGGALGAVGRLYMSQWLTEKAPFFPYGTMAVNLTGCFFIGILLGLYMLKPDLPQWLRFFLVVGGLGGFTTFSTFAFELFQLISTGPVGPALWYGGVQLAGGLALCWLGIVISRVICG